MRLFAKMKVRSDGVLEKMHEEISGEQQQWRVRAGDANALRQHFQQRSPQHEARAQRNKVAKVAFVPVFLHQNGATEAVSHGCGNAQQNACSERSDQRIGENSRSEALITQRWA